MEEDLDQISRGEREWLDFIRQFYRGDTHHRGLEEAVKQAEDRAEYPLIDVGTDPDSGDMVRVRIGRYGPFLQLEEGGTGRTAGLGRFGPYVKHGDDYRSLEATDDLFTVDLDRAVALFNAPKRSQRQATKRVIRTIEVPDGATALQVLEGRYGPYVTDGELNASIPKGTDPATLSLEGARELLDARRGAPPSTRRGRRATGGRAHSRRREARQGDKAVVPPTLLTLKPKPKPKSKPKPAARKRTVRKRAS